MAKPTRLAIVEFLGIERFLKGSKRRALAIITEYYDAEDIDSSAANLLADLMNLLDKPLSPALQEAFEHKEMEVKCLIQSKNNS